MTSERFYNRVDLMHTSVEVQCEVSGKRIPCGNVALAIKPSSDSLSNKWVSVDYISEFIDTVREVERDGDLDFWDYSDFAVVEDIGVYDSDCIVCKERWSSGDDPADVVSFYRKTCDSWCHIECVEEFCDRIENGMNSLWSHEEAEIVSQTV